MSRTFKLVELSIGLTVSFNKLEIEHDMPTREENCQFCPCATYFIFHAFIVKCSNLLLCHSIMTNKVSYRIPGKVHKLAASWNSPFFILEDLLLIKSKG